MDGKIITTNGHGGRTSSAARTLDQMHRYKRLLGTYWWIIVLTTGLSFGVAWVLFKGRPPMYRSTGRMTLNVKLALPNVSSVSGDDMLGNFFGTQVELMQSSTIQNRVSIRLREQLPLTRPVPVAIQVGLTPKASIFNLTAEGLDPDYVHEYLKATMEEYVKLKREFVENASAATTSGMQKEREYMLSQLQASKDAILNYQSSNPVVFLQKSGGTDAAEYMAILSRKLTEKESELQLITNLSLDENLEREQRAVAEQLPASQPVPFRRSARSSSTNAAETGATASSSAPGQTMGDDPSGNDTGVLAYGLASMPGAANGFGAAYLQAKQQIVLLEAEKKEKSEYMRPKHPDMIALDDEIKRQQRLLSVFEEESRRQLTHDQHVLEVQIKDLTNQLKEWQAKTIDESRKLAEFESLKLNAARLQTQCDQIQASLQALEISKGIGQESVAIFEPAGPALPIPSKLILRLALAGFIGLVLGFGIVLTRHHLDDRPGSLMELEDLLGLPVIAQIPFLKVKDKKLGLPLIEMNDDRHILVESYNNLRSALLFKDSPNGLTKSIVITSPAPGDGKTMVCANLAISLAHSGARVLLVDADLRRGQMHNRFSIREQPGLAEVLAEKCALSNAVVHTRIPNLDLLPCGLPPLRPASLLIGRIKKLLEQTNGDYDYFVFDSAPVLAADDVSSLAPQVDGVLMVIRAGSTYGRSAKSALDLLHLRKVNVIGVVFNGVNPKAREYSHYQYEEYYSTPTAHQAEDIRRSLNG